LQATPAYYYLNLAYFVCAPFMQGLSRFAHGIHALLGNALFIRIYRNYLLSDATLGAAQYFLARQLQFGEPSWCKLATTISQSCSVSVIKERRTIFST
jgi:hypothetical protein